MADSYRKIDYRVRPAKSIERKMLAEAFRKLTEFGRLDNYRYVGFGSLYFTDFVLFHKMLGFKSMISIEDEHDLEKQKRFHYNIPYGHVDLEFGSSNIVLPRLTWDVRSIVWLDYDGILNNTVLQDIAYVISKAVPGNLLLVSVNANLLSSHDDDDMERKTPLDILKALVGPEKIPAGLESKDLSGWGVARKFREIIDNEIIDTLATVNRGRSDGEKLKYKQLFNFHYQDGAKMLTIGGILYGEGQDVTLTKCGFDHLDFYRDGEAEYKIDTPLLTYREMRKIDMMIPFAATDFKNVPVPRRDIEKYQASYRYFPHFGETEMQ